MRPLRVALIVPNLRPGGAERQMMALAGRLPRDRFDVDLLALIGSGPLDSQARESGVRIRRVGEDPLHDLPLPRRIGGRVVKALRYAQIARQQRYDVVDAWLYPADVLAVMARYLSHTPIVISGRRNVEPHHYLGPVSGFIDTVMARATDAVVANSQAAADHALLEHRVDPRKLRVIRNGVELIDPASDHERAALRGRLGYGSDDLVVGCVANYREVKRHGLLLDAFAAVASRRPEARLLLVGEGPLRGEIELQVEQLGLRDMVRVHGSEPDTRLIRSTFDVAVQSSSREGLPNAVLEAAASGCAIVATAAGGTGEIIKDGETGILVETEDAPRLAEGLELMLADSTLRRRLGQQARKHVAAAFGMERFVREFGDLYEELTTSHAWGPRTRPAPSDHQGRG